MRKLMTIAAAMLAFALPGTALAQHHGDRGGYSRGHDRRYDRRDRYERRYQKRRMHHHHRGRHWRG